MSNDKLFYFIFIAILVLLIHSQEGSPLAAPQGDVTSGRKASIKTKTLPQWPRRPDPPPLTTKDYLELDLALNKKNLSVLRTRVGSFPKPTTILPRYQGRFEIQLYSTSDNTLRDVVRFNFPLAGTLSDNGSSMDLKLGGNVRTWTTVKVPWDPTIGKIAIYDSLTKSRWKVPPLTPMNHK